MQANQTCQHNMQLPLTLVICHTAGIKNVLRGLVLAMMATFLGCFLSVTLPDTVIGFFNRTMPYWFYESQVSLCSAVPLLAVPDLLKA